MEQLSIKKWHVMPFDRVQAEKFAAETGIPPLLAVLLQTRGVTDRKQAEEMLSGSSTLSFPIRFCCRIWTRQRSALAVRWTVLKKSPFTGITTPTA